jgi:uncharacterized membrane protein
MITIAIVATAFVAGAIAGVVVLLRVGMASEESYQPLLGEPATRRAAATRRIVGLYVNPDQRANQADHAADRTGAGHAQRPSTTGPGR